MKVTRIRKFVLAAAIALTSAGLCVPAHATVSGSEPRPSFALSISVYLSAALAVLGY